jgi:hypothetical protein
MPRRACGVPARPRAVRAAARCVCAVAVCLSLLAQAAPAQKRKATASRAKGGAPVVGGPAAKQGKANRPIAVEQRAEGNFTKLAGKAGPASASAAREATRSAPAPRRLLVQELPAGAKAAAPVSASRAAEEVAAPAVAGPTPAQTYKAQEDAGRLGDGRRFIPPDIHGAVGLTRSMTVTNNNYRVYEKASGAVVATVSIDDFWSPLAAVSSGITFDPRVLYDPDNDRFIHAALNGGVSADNRLFVAVSQAGDPAGDYFYYAFTVGTPNLAADFPVAGFNRNWLAVSVNMFGVGATPDPFQGNLVVLNYPAALAGTLNAGTRFVTADGVFFLPHGLAPAATLSPAENDLYVVNNFNNNAVGWLEMTKVTGTPAAPSLVPVRAASAGSQIDSGTFWNSGDEGFTGNVLPQADASTTAGAAGNSLNINAGDARVANAVFRDGHLWLVPKIGVPGAADADGAVEPGEATQRVAAQWWQLTAAGAVVQRGRVEDPTASIQNGPFPLNDGSHYGWPSIAVNRNDDVLINFTEFEEDDYADAAYAFRLGTDPLNTTRAPVVFREGEDHYSAQDGFGRNRWGDYTAAVVDPSNDRDLWALGESASQKVAVSGGFSSRHATWWARVAAPAAAGELVISEFRLSGTHQNPSAVALNEFVEIYNSADAPHAVAPADGSAGYAVAASDNVVRCTIPNGTVIPARGHFLCTNSGGYTLASYSAGAAGATGDAVYTADIPDNAGLALFNTADPANFNAATRLDAVGSAAEPNALYREGAGYPPLGLFAAEYSLLRDTSAGRPKDTNDNERDFLLVNTAGLSQCASTADFRCERLGAPGPENLSSPVQSNDRLKAALAAPCRSTAEEPNSVRDETPDPQHQSDAGTLDIRRRWTNSTGAAVTRLRFRIVDVTTYPQPSGTADLRARTSATLLNVSNPCGANALTLLGTTVEGPPAQNPPAGAGGGRNASLAVDVSAAQPVAPGASVDVRFLLGVKRPGAYRFLVNVEALP